MCIQKATARAARHATNRGGEGAKGQRDATATGEPRQKVDTQTKSRPNSIDDLKFPPLRFRNVDNFL